MSTMEPLEVGSTTIHLQKGDITEASTDAIVNAANNSLMGGGGVDGAIHRAGGPAILEACRAVRRDSLPDGLPTGEAVATTAGRLRARCVIHTVGPVWNGGESGEPDMLRRAYTRSLEVAREEDLRTVAFPSISTGAYGYPKPSAARIAIGSVADYVDDHPDAFDEVHFVLFSQEDLQIYQEALSELKGT